MRRDRADAPVVTPDLQVPAPEAEPNAEDLAHPRAPAGLEDVDRRAHR